MPSKKNPASLSIGQGLAGQNSVTQNSIVGNGGGVGGGGLVLGSQVSILPPLAISGDNVQEHVDGIAGLAPEVPNLLGSNTKPQNPSNLTTVPTLVTGLTGDPASAVTVTTTNPLVVEGILFPADRGILCAEIDSGAGYVPVCALNLEVVFTEGSPEATVAPARIVGQNDYVAGSNVNADVDGLPQNINLTDRLPRLTDYTRASFPFLAAGVDPVYDAYAEAFGGQQLARVQVNIPLAAPGLIGAVRLVHYRDLTEYLKGKAGLTAVAYSTNILSTNLYLDQSAVAVAIGSYTLVPSDTADSAEVGAARRALSGILYYSDGDTFALNFAGTGLYDDTFLNEGFRLRSDPGSDVRTDPLVYTGYSPSGTAAGDPSSQAIPAYTNATFGVVAATPELIAEDPQGNTDTFAYVGSTILLNASPTFGVANATLEYFDHEVSRYTVAVGGDPTNTMLPDGTGSTFSSTADITGDVELQVRGLPAGRVRLTDRGGELAYPDTDYSAGHYPTTSDGVTAQRDYSAALAIPRGYARAFDMGGQKLRGKLRIVGTPTAGSANLYEDFQVSTSTGVSIAVAPAGVPEAIHRNLGRPLGDGDGCAVDVVIESANSVVIEFQLNTLPVKQSGVFPLALLILLDGTGAASTAGEFGIQKIEYLDV